MAGRARRSAERYSGRRPEPPAAAMNTQAAPRHRNTRAVITGGKLKDTYATATLKFE